MIPGTVAVGVVHPGEWSTAFALCYQDLMLWDLGRSQRVICPDRPDAGTWRLTHYCPSGDLSAARNTVAATFLDHTQREWLFTVDTDMGFGPDTIDRLVAAADPVDRPVVGGLAFSMKREGRGPFYSSVVDMFPTLYDWFEDDTTAGFVARSDYPADEIVSVAATGSACMLVHRTVLERLRAEQGDMWYDRVRHPLHPGGFGEDLSFCIRAASVDAPVHVATGVKTNHDKGGLQLNEVTFDRQMRAVRAEARDFMEAFAELACGALPATSKVPAGFALVG